MKKKITLPQLPVDMKHLKAELKKGVAKYRSGESVKYLVNPQHSINFVTCALISVVADVEFMDVYLKKLSEENLSKVETKYKEFSDFGKNNNVMFELGEVSP